MHGIAGGIARKLEAKTVPAKEIEKKVPILSVGICLVKAEAASNLPAALQPVISLNEGIRERSTDPVRVLYRSTISTANNNHCTLTTTRHMLHGAPHDSANIYRDPRKAPFGRRLWLAEKRSSLALQPASKYLILGNVSHFTTWRWLCRDLAIPDCALCNWHFGQTARVSSPFCAPAFMLCVHCL